MRYGNRFVYSAISLLIVITGGARLTPGQTAKDVRSKEQSRFSLEQPFKEPVPVPNEVLQVLKKDFSVTASGCDADKVSAASFEASELHLEGPLEVQLLVKAKDGCLLGANIGPFWIFKQTPQGYDLILSVSALGLEVLPSRSNRYRNVRVGAAAGGHPVYVIYKFDGRRYQEGSPKDTAKK